MKQSDSGFLCGLSLFYSSFFNSEHFFFYCFGFHSHHILVALSVWSQIVQALLLVKNKFFSF